MPAQCTTLEGVEVDISLNSAGGLHAAAFLREQQKVWKALKPLTLLLKAFLKVCSSCSR